ncbi:MAG TPA: response regulator, partial [Streptosporangiaceae bacterium]
MTKLVVGDDHVVFLDALAAVLAQQDFTVIMARTLPDAVQAVARQQPDLCLLDRHFAGEDGISAIETM